MNNQSSTLFSHCSPESRRDIYDLAFDYRGFVVQWQIFKRSDQDLRGWRFEVPHGEAKNLQQQLDPYLSASIPWNPASLVLEPSFFCRNSRSIGKVCSRHPPWKLCTHWCAGGEMVEGGRLAEPEAFPRLEGVARLPKNTRWPCPANSWLALSKKLSGGLCSSCAAPPTPAKDQSSSCR